MANLLSENDKRTCRCGELGEKDIGKNVTVMGWTQRQRDLGQLIFIDLRDRSGIIQLSFDKETDAASFETAYGVRSETVLMAKGVVRSRGENAINRKIPTGSILPLRSWRTVRCVPNCVCATATLTSAVPILPATLWQEAR